MLDKGMLDGGLELADKVFSECLFDEPDLLDTWTNLPDHPLQQEEPNGDRHWIKSSPALQVLLIPLMRQSQQKSSAFIIC